MSLASDFASAKTAADAVDAAVIPPASFIGPSGRADVSPTGGLVLTRTSGGTFEITAVQALAFRDWITTTFG